MFPPQEALRVLAFSKENAQRTTINVPSKSADRVLPRSRVIRSIF